MSDTETTTAKVQILDKEYTISCKADEREALMNSARYLDQKMREIRSSGKILGLERIAVMSALNLSHELVQERDENARLRGAMQRMSKRLEEAMPLSATNSNSKNSA